MEGFNAGVAFTARPYTESELVGEHTLVEIIDQILMDLPGTPHWSVLRNAIARIQDEREDTEENRQRLRDVVTEAMEEVTAPWKELIISALPKAASKAE